MRTIVYTKPTDCTNFSINHYRFCLPDKVNCLGVYGGWTGVCDNLWCDNMRLPSDVPYLNPIPDGEKFHLQFQFFDDTSTDRKAPDAGWGDWINIQLYDKAGTLIKDTSVDAMTTIASGWFVGWDGYKMVQVIEIDTSLFAMDCFSFRAYTSGGQEVCTEPFKRITECSQTIELESSYEGEDCLGFSYREMEAVLGTEFAYRNRIWVNGSIRNAGGENTVENYGISLITSVEVLDLWALHVNDKIPPNLERYLRGVIFAGRDVTINSETYTYEEVRTQVLAKSQMFFLGFPIQRKCIKEHSNC